MGLPKKISQLPVNITLTGNDVFATVNNIDVTSKVNLGQIKDFILTGKENTFVTGGTVSELGTLTLFRNDGLSEDIDLLPAITGNTIQNGLNIPGGEGQFFDSIENNTIFFRSLAGGSNVIISSDTVNKVVTIDVDINPTTNTFLTGGTLSGSTLVLERNDDDKIPIDLSNLSGNTSITSTSLSGTVYTINENDGNTFSTDFNPIISGFTTGSTLQEVLDNGSNGTISSGNFFVEYSTPISTSRVRVDSLSAYLLSKNGNITPERVSTIYGDKTGEIYLNSDFGATKKEIRINESNMLITDTESSKGLEYLDDYSTNFTNRSLVDKEYVDKEITGATSQDVSISSTTLTGNEYIITETNGVSFPTNFEPIISGKLDTDIFDTYTSTTVDNDTKILSTTLTGSEYTITETNGSAFTTDFNTIVSGKLDTDIFDTYTSTTVDNDTKILSTNLLGTEYTITETNGSAFTTDFNTIVSGKLDTDIFDVYTANTLDIYVTGGTLNGTNLSLGRTDDDSVSIDLSALSGVTQNSFVTGFTYDNNNNFTINRNDGLSALTTNVNTMSGLTINGNLNLSLPTNDNTLTQILGRDSSTGEIKHINTSILSGTPIDSFVSGFTYTPSANTLEITLTENKPSRSVILESFNDIELSGLTYINGNAVVEENVLIKGSVVILGTATTINSGTLTVDDNVITLNANATGSTAPIPIDSGIDILRNSGETAVLLWEELNGYWAAGFSGNTEPIILNGENLGGGENIFDGRVTNKLTFNTLSGGNYVNLTKVGNVITIDTPLSPDTNTFITGTTLNGTEYTINENNGSAFTTNFNTIISGKLDTDIFDTYTSTTVDNDTTITNFSYDNNNNLTIGESNGSAFTVNISQMTGLTVNGELTVTGNTQLDGRLTVEDQTWFKGSPTTFGNSVADSIDFTGRINGNFVPVNDNSSDMGKPTTVSSKKYWRNFYVYNITGGTLNLFSGLTTNNTASEILVRNSGTGDIEKRDITSIETTANTIFTSGVTSVVPTEQTILLEDSIEFKGSTLTYSGFKFEPARSVTSNYDKIFTGPNTFLTKYCCNQGYSFGTDSTENSFHFNTGASTMSDGWAMRVHSNTDAANGTYGGLILKGYDDTNGTTPFNIVDSGNTHLFSVKSDGVISGKTLYLGTEYVDRQNISQSLYLNYTLPVSSTDISGTTVLVKNPSSNLVEGRRLSDIQVWMSGDSGTGSIKSVKGTLSIDGDYALGQGFSNEIYQGDYSSTIGGTGNTIEQSDYTTLIGGRDNTLKKSSNVTSIGVISSAGTETIREGDNSVLLGGIGNTLQSVENSSILNGNLNKMENPTGGDNIIYESSIIGGKYNNLVDGQKSSSILGGNSNFITGLYNTTSGETSITDNTILGGSGNTITKTSRSGILGGFNNTLNSSDGDTVLMDTTQNSNIVGGDNNSITGAQYNSTIVGGSGNTITGYKSNPLQSIINGKENSILGGAGNNISSVERNGIIGGTSNIINGEGSVTNNVIAGGLNNYINGVSNKNIFIGGGTDNNVIPNAFPSTSPNSAIIAGSGNTIFADTQEGNIVILGGNNITATTENTVYVPNLNIDSTPTLNNTATQILVRNSSTNEVEYRDVSSIGGGGNTVNDATQTFNWFMTIT